MSNLNWRRPPEKYSTTWDWARKYNIKKRDTYYKSFNFSEDGRLYTAPKSLDETIHWKFVHESKPKPPPTFLAVIPNGRVCGKNGAVITPDKKLLWDVSFEYFTTPDSHSIFKKKRLPLVRDIKATVAVLTFCHSQVYYHWMFDVLPRIALIQKANIKVSKLIFNQFKPLPFQKETLRALNINNRQIIPWHKNLHLKAEQLLVPSLLGYSFHMPKWTCAFLRKTFLNDSNQQPLAGFERIYISREHSNHRHILNENRVMNLLSNYGFKKIILETLPFSKQVQIFQSAKIIVSAHGSGLANLVFCNPKTKVLELFSPSFVQIPYWVISNHVNLDYHYLIGEEGSSPAYVDSYRRVWDDICINLEKLSCILENML